MLSPPSPLPLIHILTFWPAHTMSAHQVLVYNSSLDQWKRLWVMLPNPGLAPGSCGVQVNE